ncbi:MAG TPA: hypothetical protein VFX12_11620 [Vicinamibacterales bacterium]|nr:hypothetical protein [Vicinamibacterales bacterium]
MSRNESDAAAAFAAAEAVRKAYAVGLIERSPDFPELTYPDVRQTASRVREAGIAVRAAALLERREPPPADELMWALREIDARLEESPLPRTEWPRMAALFDRDQLARLLRISPSSVVRYQHGERTTPDDVAARLHMLALLTGDLAGAYNEIGIRRWFERPRTALDGRTPASLLRARWSPDDEGPKRVRALARALVASPAA